MILWGNLHDIIYIYLFIYACTYDISLTDVMIICIHMQFCKTNHASYWASSAWKLGFVPTNYWWLHRFFQCFLGLFWLLHCSIGVQSHCNCFCWRVIMSRDHMEGAQFGSTFSCASAASLILPHPHVQALKESAARALTLYIQRVVTLENLDLLQMGGKKLKQVSMSQMLRTLNHKWTLITSSLVSLCNASY